MATIRELAEELLRQYQERTAGKVGDELTASLEKEDWQALVSLFTGVVPPFPNMPGPFFVPVMSRNVPASVELVLPEDGGVRLVKRKWFGEDAYHTPGSYMAPGETFLQTAQRCADRELKVKVTSAEPIPGAVVNHPVHPRFHDLSVLLECEVEGKPQVGEVFNKCPRMLEVQSDYWQHIEPLLK